MSTRTQISFGKPAHRLAALALVVLWASVQSLALTHTHDLSAAHEPCGVCASAQLDDLIPVGDTPLVVSAVPSTIAAVPVPARRSVPITRHYAPRAPPVSLTA